MRAAKSKSERGLVSEARKSERTATCFLWYTIIIPRILGVRTENCPRLFTFDQKHKPINVKKNNKRHLNQLRGYIVFRYGY